MRRSSSIAAKTISQQQQWWTTTESIHTQKNRVAFCIQSYWFHLIVDTAHQHFHNKNWWDRQWHFWLHAHTHKLNCQTMEIIYRLRPDWSRWYNVMSNNVKVPLMEECLIENAGCWLNRCINAQNRNRWLVV